MWPAAGQRLLPSSAQAPREPTSETRLCPRRGETWTLHKDTLPNSLGEAKATWHRPPNSTGKQAPGTRML